MKRQFRYLAQALRHLPWIERRTGFWSSLRRPYHALLRVGGNGVPVCVGGVCEVRMPPEYSGTGWETYEPVAIQALADWVIRHPDGTILDLGSSLGIMSVCALSLSWCVRVIAFDSDLASLKATQRMTSLVDRQRLRVVYGFVSNRHLSGRSLAEAEQYTLRCIEESGVTGDVDTTRYVCLDSNHAVEIPSNSLDGLLLNDPTVRAPVLVKCDIEGAEQLALEGARQWLAEISPSVLLRGCRKITFTFYRFCAMLSV